MGEFLRQVLVKPDVNNVRDNGRNVRSALDCLNQSDVIVIMGSSIGATDSFWWRVIAKTMKNRPSMKLIWVSYHSTLPDIRSLEEFEMCEKCVVVSRLARACGDEDDGCEILHHIGRNILVTSYGPFIDFDFRPRYFDPLGLGWIGKKCGLA